jgi:uncharacterized membrane protein YGL010W
MTDIQTLLNEYGESHQNKINKTIHWICVPLIVFSLMGMLWSIPAGPLAYLATGSLAPFANWATVFVLLSLVYYIALSRVLFLAMIPVTALVLGGNYLLSQSGAPLLLVSIAIFVGAWIGQFIGHKVEGKKPSFFKDLQFLMIGPAWLLSFVFGKAGIRF